MNDTTHSVFDSPACCIYLSNFRGPKKGQPSGGFVARGLLKDAGRRGERSGGKERVGKGLQGLGWEVGIQLCSN